MHIIVTDSDIINADYFPVITRNGSALIFGYEDDFNAPITLYFNSADEAQNNLAIIAAALAAGDKVCELSGVMTEQEVLSEDE